MSAVDAGVATAEGPRDRLLELGLRSVIRLADWIGVEATLAVGAAVGRAWFALRLPRVGRVLEQLALAFPERGASERRAWAREVFEHLGRGLAELVLLSGRHRAVLLDRMRIEGLEHLERAQNEAGGRGAILIGPHLGNWELGAARLAEQGIRVSAVYRGLGQPALDRAIRRVRAGAEASGGSEASSPGVGAPIEQIPMGRRAGVRFVRALADGRHVLALLDQRARGEEGMEIRFFGRPAATRFGPLKLAERTGAPVLLAFARREPDGRGHRLTIHPPLQLEPGSSDDPEVLRRNLQRITAAFEQEIRATPGQWIWTHRRWRGRSRSGRTG
jgi:KDO2-lipid IV(A) lauroyltransferase